MFRCFFSIFQDVDIQKIVELFESTQYFKFPTWNMNILIAIQESKAISLRHNMLSVLNFKKY